jgi:hypothetical protein
VVATEVRDEVENSTKDAFGWPGPRVRLA